MSCQHSRGVGHLVEHEVKFERTDGSHGCTLSPGNTGTFEHKFVNRTIYPRTFDTTLITTPSALAAVGSVSPAPVRVLPARRKLIYQPPSTGRATQGVEHQLDPALGLPHTATADFTTTVTGPATTAGPQTGPSLNIDLVQ